MKYSILLVALLATMGLSGCEKTVVTPAASTVPGPAGAPGAAGAEGSKGEPGKAADTVIVVPAK